MTTTQRIRLAVSGEVLDIKLAQPDQRRALADHHRREGRPMTTSFDVSGFDELESQLANLDLAVQKKVLREVARTSAQPVLADTRSLYEQNWDHDTGQLGESIKLQVSIPRNPTWPMWWPRSGCSRTTRCRWRQAKPLTPRCMPIGWNTVPASTASPRGQPQEAQRFGQGAEARSPAATTARARDAYSPRHRSAP